MARETGDIAALRAHLAGGATTVCRCWAVTRRDGARFGFTDHDRDLVFAGTTFRAASGMTASALQQGTGLAVDNSQAAGALSDGTLTEADLMAGLFDGATVEIWRVNWAAVSQRERLFRGVLGEIRRGDGAFEAELRGLAELLNRPSGMVYQRACTAVLGDARCAFDLDRPGYAAHVELDAQTDGEVFDLPDPGGFPDRWFAHGTLRVETGAAAGLGATIKSDRSRSGARRRLTLWEPLRRAILPGDRVLLHAGCDKRAATCREKFDNFLNFRGFPHIPGEDWLTSYPAGSTPDDGGSMNR